MNEIMKKEFSMKRLILFLLLSALSITKVLAQGLPPEVLRYADMILYNGKVVTMDDKTTNLTPGTMVEALAIRDGKILALGRSEEIRRYGGPNTVRIDVKGRTV